MKACKINNPIQFNVCKKVRKKYVKYILSLLIKYPWYTAVCKLFSMLNNNSRQQILKKNLCFFSICAAVVLFNKRKTYKEVYSSMAFLSQKKNKKRLLFFCYWFVELEGQMKVDPLSESTQPF